MKEVYPGIYQIRLSKKLSAADESAEQVYSYLIPSKSGRSLMVDTGYKSPESVQCLQQALSELHISPEMLDVLVRIDMVITAAGHWHFRKSVQSCI